MSYGSSSSRATLLTRTVRSCATALHHLLQVRRSRWYYRMGQGTSTYYRGALRAALVPDRFYRKALRGLPGQSLLLPRVRAESVIGVPLHQTVGARLSEYGFRRWLWRRRLPILATAAALLALSTILVGFVPPLRRALIPADLAAGQIWTASSAWGGYPQTGVMSEASPAIGFFHTVEQPSPWVSVDLGAVVAIAEVKVDNRRDCCRERALPLALELSVDGTAWRRVGYRRAEFRTWSATFPSTPARFVRARLDRVGILHLRGIRVH